MNYDNGSLFAIAAVLAPYFEGSAVIPNAKEPPSWLEKKIALNRQYPQANGHNHVYNPFVMVPFHRGVRSEAKKEPAPLPPQIHGYRTPRKCYRKAAEHR